MTNFNHDELRKLREIFREDMKQHDYCIGEEYVETLFRRLLGESLIPAKSNQEFHHDIAGIIQCEMDKVIEQLPLLFERDDTFYKKIK